jgi:hypothetical protein
VRLELFWAVSWPQRPPVSSFKPSSIVAPPPPHPFLSVPQGGSCIGYRFQVRSPSSALHASTRVSRPSWRWPACEMLGPGQPPHPLPPTSRRDFGAAHPQVVSRPLPVVLAMQAFPVAPCMPGTCPQVHSRATLLSDLPNIITLPPVRLHHGRDFVSLTQYRAGRQGAWRKSPTVLVAALSHVFRLPLALYTPHSCHLHTHIPASALSGLYSLSCSVTPCLTGPRPISQLTS